MCDKIKTGFVGLIGRANVGKSTLLNSLMLEKISITSPTVQTTRNTITGIKNGENSQIIFLDTPGLHKPYDKLGTVMNNSAFDVINRSDIICLLFPIDEYSGKGDIYIINQLKQENLSKPVFALITKVDKKKKSDILKKINYLNNLYSFNEIMPISAKMNDNLDLLEEKIIEYLPYKEKKYYDKNIKYLSSRDFFIKEFIREKIYKMITQEVPHSTFVVIDLIDENENYIDIKSSIVVERDSQKGILIGHKGKMISSIRISAQKDLSIHFNKKVYLDLLIKVKQQWRKKNHFDFNAL